MAELEDPSNGRYRYPSIHCTECGPQYSIGNSLSYERANTTMAGWPLGAACRAAYDDRWDRRHDAQVKACPFCGPSYRLVHGGAVIARGADAIAQAAALLNAGMIVAVKGIGGYTPGVLGTR